ncbi:glycosyltransferase [Psychroflexus planctonicus]|uniref:Glycosyl transferase n=1 Tax=Psychroflexus planctonicus TaxID=1526575 RepID=A0ABQ1SIZ8_9FLAO|nr:glycosyltransferase [Psychroflexus planctonicus]GGE36949.1 glycosyl transferase [Psychroflexus planctonicus]
MAKLGIFQASNEVARVFMPQKTILVAPLNWGLGHATRCVPIIHALLADGFKVVLASDGMAYQFLEKEFPQLPIYKLASLHVFYAEKKKWQTLNMLKQIPKLYKFISEDQLAIEKLAKQIKIDGIISDNRPGVFLAETPCAYINHQLNVKSGVATPFSSKLHQNLMKNFDEIWVPDVEDEPSLSGELGHLSKAKNLPTIKYLGWLSRLQPENNSIIYDFCAVISGPEPQRTLFENALEELFQKLPGCKVMVTGNPDKNDNSEDFEKCGMLNSSELNRLIAQSNLLICRSGYTSLMDLLKMQKQALLVPTPGQFEQEYLAKRMQELGWFSVCNQEDLLEYTLKNMEAIQTNRLPNFQDLKLDFSLFK